ncbi:hypothetical protein BDR26DRAFT_890916 [Obelidium mucronatum]|nr:hypothetical protein BDR26DRAFT_890916 [Obelidium mucronatum]
MIRHLSLGFQAAWQAQGLSKSNNSGNNNRNQKRQRTLLECLGMQRDCHHVTDVTGATLIQQSAMWLQARSEKLYKKSHPAPSTAMSTTTSTTTATPNIARKNSNAHRLDTLLASMRAEFERDDFSPPVSPAPQSQPESADSFIAPLFVGAESTLAHLAAGGGLAHAGPLLKLSGSGAWRPRFFALTVDARLFLFRAGARASTAPVTFLPLAAAGGFFNALLNAWVLTVAGAGRDSSGAVVRREWTLSCGASEPVFAEWRARLAAAVPFAAAPPPRTPRCESLAPHESALARSNSLRLRSPPADADAAAPRLSRSATSITSKYLARTTPPAAHPHSSHPSLDRPTSADPSLDSVPSLTGSNQNRYSGHSGNSSFVIAPAPSSRAFSNLPAVLEHRAASLDVQIVPSSLRFPSSSNSRRNLSFDVPRSNVNDDGDVEGMMKAGAPHHVGSHQDNNVNININNNNNNTKRMTLPARNKLDGGTICSKKETNNILPHE